MRAVIVIGPMKTGTSAIAAGFTALQRQGALPPWVTYPIDDLWPFQPRGTHIFKHLALKALDGGAPRQRATIDAGAVHEVLTSIATRDVSDRSSELVVFVSEMLALRFTRGTLRVARFDAEMRKRFDTVDYLLTVRRQDEAVRSVVHQAVRGHRGENWAASTDLDISKLPERMLRQFDYWAIHQLFTAEGLGDSLTLVPFVEDDIGTSRHLLRMTEAMGIGLVDTTVTDLDRRLIHPSLSKRDLDRIARIRSVQRRFNRGSLADRVLDRAWQTQRQVSTRRAMRKPREGLGPSYPRWRMTEEESNAILEHYRESNEHLFALHPEVDFLSR